MHASMPSLTVHTMIQTGENGEVIAQLCQRLKAFDERKLKPAS